MLKNTMIKDILVTASGYEFFWQIGVLDTLAKEPFFNDVETLYGNSGGGFACAYTVSFLNFEEVLHEKAAWWSENIGRPRKMDFWRDGISSNLNVYKKARNLSVFVGASRFNGFKWNFFDPTMLDTFESLCCSAHIPGVLVLSNFTNLKNGVDGHILFNPKKHIPNPKETLTINALPMLFAKVPNGGPIISRKGLPTSLIGKLPAQKFIDDYYAGVESAKRFQF